MDIYQKKIILDDKYKNYTRNDLLWVLALLNSKTQKSYMKGPVLDYFVKMCTALPQIKEKIKQNTPRGFTPLKTNHNKNGLFLLSGEIDGIPVMQKKFLCTNGGDEDDIEGLKKSIYETLIYKHFFSYLTENKITPNVPYYFGMKYLSNDSGETVSLYTEFFEDGSSLYDYLKQATTKLTVDFWRPLLFQIIWTLTAFQNLSLVHNDLHIQNIYLLTGLTGKIAYKNNGQKYIINLNNVPLVKIYDMDLSSTKCETGDPFLIDYTNYIDPNEVDECYNQYINDYFESLGISKIAKKSQFDLFVAVCTILINESNSDLFKRLIDQTTLQFIYKVFEPIDFIKEKEFHCRLKSITDAGKGLKELLNDDYFKPLIGDSVETIPTFQLV